MTPVLWQTWLSAARQSHHRALLNQVRSLRSRPFRAQFNGPGRQRFSSSAREHQSTWTTPKVLVATTFAALTTYLLATQFSTSAKATAIRKPKYASQKQLAKAIEEIQAALGEHSVSIDEHDIYSHGFSDFSSFNIDTYPWAVAYPNSTAEVSTIAMICHKYKVPMSEFSGTI
jgi:D-lactate dehydrogenase (cytochrome)